MLLRFVLSGAFFFSFFVSLPANAQFFRDDFDNSATDGDPVTWAPRSPYEAGERNVMDGAYVLRPGDEPNNQDFVDFAESDSFVEEVEFGDVSIRTRARAANSGEYWFGVFARSDSDTSVFAAMSEMGRIAISAHDDTVPSDEDPLNVLTGIIPHETDVELQLDVYDNTARLTVWESGSEKPTRPQLVIDELPEFVSSVGNVGVWAGNFLLAGKTPVAFSFFEAVPIPEPSTAALCLVGVITLACCRRRFT